MKILLATAFVALLSVSGCGAAGSQDLQISFLPNKAFLVPGTGSSCLDYATYAANAGSGVELGASVQPYRVVYPQFSLTWTGSELLYVAFINVTVRGSNISGGTTTIQLTNTDVEPMLGIGSGAAFNGFLYPFTLTTPKTITTSTTRTFNPPGGQPITFPPCSFTVGGISLTDSNRAFGGQVQIDVVGFSVAADGSQNAVQQRANLDFQYEP
jgi:hypothetical protein